MINLDEKTIFRYKEFTEWTDTLHDVHESIWLQPISDGKASVGEIISHLQNWDSYLIFTIIPALKNGEGMVFPDFDSFNKIAYEYARSGIPKDRLLDEFKQTRLHLVEILFAFPASDATMAAVNAANATPFRPAGNRFIRVGYA